LFLNNQLFDLQIKLKLCPARMFCAAALGIGPLLRLVTATEAPATTACLSGGLAQPKASAIPWSQIGVKAGSVYHGEGLSVSPIPEGARLRCAFQRLEGEATCEGLWLISAVLPQGGTTNEHFRVVTTAIGRDERSMEAGASGRQGIEATNAALPSPDADLPTTGTVSVDGQRVRFTRPGLVEEYSVSIDGVQQDFVVLNRPAGAGQLALRLEVSGAQVGRSVFGVELVLEQSRRKIAYGRLRVTDAIGKELKAEIQVAASGCMVEDNRFRRGRRLKCADSALTVLVEDARAVYPIRIDPTFSDANWVSMGGIAGANAPVYATALDGSGNLYIGGTFTSAGETFANYIARWDGNNWSALSSEPDGNIYALVFLGTNLYAGGDFTTAGASPANHVAQWDGNSWSALGSGLDDFVDTLVVSGSNLYAGGNFIMAGSNDVNYVAKWDGSGWTALGSGMNNQVEALAAAGSNLYAGGRFTLAGGTTANYIAQWDGSSWTTLGSGMNDTVYALAVGTSNLYAGGHFKVAGDATANYVAQWDGSHWTGLGSGPNAIVYALATWGTNLYAGGIFPLAGTNAVYSIAQWDGVNWSPLNSGLGNSINSPSVYALTVWSNYLYVGGDFGSADGNPANYIAQWDVSSNSWAGFGSDGLNGYVYALAVMGGDVFLGGDFSNASQNIAQWDGANWTGLGLGLNRAVYTLTVLSTNLYAGGLFTTADGNPANYVASWDGNSWSPLGSGLSAADPRYTEVDALAVLGKNLYVGGNFTTADGTAANYIAQWDGTNWSALGSGMSGPVNALAASGNLVYAGGTFTNAGANPANYIAQWDRSSWSALGSGVNGAVNALAVSGSNVYAGGSFTNAGTSTANYIAKWNGSSWTPLGSGMDGPVDALVMSGSDLYVGGSFTNAGGSVVNNIAMWDGSRWSPLGSGMDGPVNALAVLGSNLYAGGSFLTAGHSVSYYIAYAQLPTPPGLEVSRSGNNVTVFWPSADTAGFTLEQTVSLTPPISWVSSTGTVTDDGTNKSVTIPATNSSQFFRLHGP
jgi:hypothetical protein